MPGRWLILPVFLLLAHNCAARFQLSEDFQRDLPPGMHLGLPHPVVCPDDLVGQGGRVMVLDRQGRIASDTHQTILKSATALVCDTLGRLYVASPNFIAVVEPTSAGDYRVVSRGYAKIFAYAMVAADNGRLFVAGRRAGNGLPIHTITTDGKTIRSFGEGSPRSDPQPVLIGRILALERSQRSVVDGPADNAGDSGI